MAAHLIRAKHVLNQREDALGCSRGRDKGEDDPRRLGPHRHLGPVLAPEGEHLLRELLDIGVVNRVDLACCHEADRCRQIFERILKNVRTGQLPTAGEVTAPHTVSCVRAHDAPGARVPQSINCLRVCVSLRLPGRLSSSHSS